MSVVVSNRIITARSGAGWRTDAVRRRRQFGQICQSTRHRGGRRCRSLPPDAPTEQPNASITNQTAWADQGSKTVALFGKILDAETEQPLSAQVKYRLLPVGHTTGIRNFANEDGSYQLPLQPFRQYQLEVASEDHVTLRVVVETDERAQLTQDLRLRPIPKPGELVRLPQPILFERGKTIPTTDSREAIDQLKTLLDDYPKMKIMLEGHTDRGNSRQLMKLSEERAEAIKDRLVGLGISRRRIKTEAFGHTQLVSREDTFESRQQNRRVEARVLEIG